MAVVYEKLKRMREEAGLRQEQIAEFLGVTQTYISKIETGERNLTVDQLERLANLYGYSLSSFVNTQDDIRPMQFAFRASEVSQKDLEVIADVGRIAINSRFMAEILEDAND